MTVKGLACFAARAAPDAPQHYHHRTTTPPTHTQFFPLAARNRYSRTPPGPIVSGRVGREMPFFSCFVLGLVCTIDAYGSARSLRRRLKVSLWIVQNVSRVCSEVDSSGGDRVPGLACGPCRPDRGYAGLVVLELSVLWRFFGDRGVRGVHKGCGRLGQKRRNSLYSLSARGCLSTVSYKGLGSLTHKGRFGETQWMNINTSSVRPRTN